jgi:hypothetical protein
LRLQKFLDLKKNEAEKIIDDIGNKVSDWKTIAGKYDIPKTEQLRMEKAFQKR